MNRYEIILHFFLTAGVVRRMRREMAKSVQSKPELRYFDN